MSPSVLSSLLLRYEFIDIYPVNPQTLARHRDAWHPSGAKDDPTDAKLALEVLQKHRDKLKPLRPQSVDMRALRRCVEDRRPLVNDRVRVTNRITAALKGYYPQVLDRFEDKGDHRFATSSSAGRVLTRPVELDRRPCECSSQRTTHGTRAWWTRASRRSRQQCP